MLFPLAVDNPPLQFEFGGAIDINWVVADRRDGAIKGEQIVQGLFIVVPGAPFLENKRSFRGLISEPLRSQPRRRYSSRSSSVS